MKRVLVSERSVTMLAYLLRLAAVALPLAMVGCQSSPARDGNLRLRIWSMWNGDEEGYFQTALKAYERSHPNIKFENVTTNYADDKTIRAIIAGSPPDLCSIAEPALVGQFAASDSVLCLEELFARSRLRSEDFTPGSIGQCRYQGKLYAMPYLVDCIALLWNKDAFAEAGLDPDQPPRTLDELQQYAVRLTKRDAKGNLIRLGCQIAATRYGLLFALFGGRLYDEQRDAITADDPRNAEALRWYKQFLDAQGGLARVNAFAAGFGTGQSAENPFFVGKIAMMFDGQWNPYWAFKYAPKLRYAAAAIPGRDAETGGHGDAATRRHSNTTTVNPLPGVPASPRLRVPASPGPPFAWLGGNFFVIPKESRHPKEAWDFYVWMQSAEAQFLFADTMHGVPNTFAALRDERLRDPRESWRPVFGKFMEVAGSRNATHSPVLPMMGFYDRVMTTAVESVGFGNKTPEQALRDVQQRVSREYAKWRGDQ